MSRAIFKKMIENMNIKYDGEKRALTSVSPVPSSERIRVHQWSNFHATYLFSSSLIITIFNYYIYLMK